MWWQLFPHQGFSSSSRCTSWAQRTADTLSATQNMREMAQRHRLELCRVDQHKLLLRDGVQVDPKSPSKPPVKAEALT